jgi:hypothetical protein
VHVLIHGRPVATQITLQPSTARGLGNVHLHREHWPRSLRPAHEQHGTHSNGPAIQSPSAMRRLCRRCCRHGGQRNGSLKPLLAMNSCSRTVDPRQEPAKVEGRPLTSFVAFRGLHAGCKPRLNQLRKSSSAARHRLAFIRVSFFILNSLQTAAAWRALALVLLACHLANHAQRILAEDLLHIAVLVTPFQQHGDQRRHL